MIRRFARPYGRVILEISGSPEKARTVLEELSKFEEARKVSPELGELFANPGIDGSHKLAVAKKIGDRLSLSELSGRVIELLIRNHRINELSAVLETVSALINTKLGIAVAKVRTAHDLNDAEKSELKSALEKKLGQMVDLQLETDASLLGGFVATVGSEVFDASITGKINLFRKQLATQ